MTSTQHSIYRAQPTAVSIASTLAVALAVALASVLAIPHAASAGEVPYSTEPNLATGIAVSAILLTDLDGDGDLDAIYSDTGLGTNRTRWQTNSDGAGTFTTDQTLFVGAAGGNGLAAADIDRNGKIDVVIASSGGVDWRQNPSDGSSSYTVDALFSTTNGVAVGDIDGDGWVDIVTAVTGSLTFSWYRNDGTPASGAWTRRGISTGPLTTPYAVDVADINGDGHLDVVAADLGASTAYYFENDGTPLDGGWVQNTITNSSSGPTRIKAADMNGDGAPDVVLANQSSGIVEWWENDGTPASGAWSRHEVVSTAGTAYESVWPVDVDGDGDFDLVIGGDDTSPSNNDVVGWYENTDGLGTTWLVRSVDTSPGSGFLVAPGDMDGDGDFDIYAASQVGKITWYRQDRIHSTPRFADELPIATSENYPRDLELVDIDSDGDLDLVTVTDFSTSDLAWFENSGGDPTSWARVEIEPDRSFREINAGDLDGDGDPDLVVPIRSAHTIAWYDNSAVAGDGSTWVGTDIYTTANRIEQLDLVDLDRDGDLDVLFAAPSNSTDLLYEVGWLANDGSAGTWTPTTIDTDAEGPRAVGFGDLDGDGDVDVVSASIDDDQVQWHENTNAVGTTWTDHAIGGFLDGDQIRVRDMDADGDLDFVVAGASSEEFSVYINDGTPGDGGWTRVDPGGQGSHSGDDIEVVDMDADGDLDVVQIAGNIASVLWAENPGDALSWTKHFLDASTISANQVAVGDLDNDGDFDILTASPGTDRFSLHENQGGQLELETTGVGFLGEIEDSTSARLRITATHLGKNSENDLELASLEFRFDDGNGTPLTTIDANAIFDQMQLWLDDGDDTFETGQDTLAATVGDFTLATGLLSVAITDADPEFQISQGTPATFHVVLEYSAAASSQSPNTFRITHVTESSATAEDASADLAATIAFAANVASPVVTLLDDDGAADDDGDGLSNSDEVAIHGTDPTLFDSDGDGVSDGAEIGAGSDPNDVTSDNDPWMDGVELALGSDPNVTGSLPTISALIPFAQSDIETSAGAAKFISTADIDGDGDLDTIVNSTIGGALSWFDNTSGDGTSWTERPIDTSISSPIANATGDLDGDGDTDILLTVSGAASVVWYQNAGGNGLTWNEFTIDTQTHGVFGCDIADFDGDGDMDVIVGIRWDDEVMWYENDLGDASSWTPHLVATEDLSYRDVAAADFDGDGDFDFATVAHLSDRVLWYENDAGDASSWTRHLIDFNSSGGPTTRPAWTAPADFDGDGDMDLAVSFENRDRVVFYENADGDASVWTKTFVTDSQVHANGASVLEAADFDDDGDFDLLLGMLGGMVWFENAVTDGSLWIPRVLSATRAPGVAVGDVDGDGDLDALMVSDTTTLVAWFDNETIHRNATFPSTVQIATGDSPDSVAAADLDGDGDHDLIALASGDSELEWYENTAGDGSTWGVAQLIDASAPSENALGSAFQRLSTADLDRDGDLDILAATQADNRTVWHENRLNENLGFDEHLITDAIDDPSGVFAADIDGDGDLDPVVGSNSEVSAEVRWFRNDSLSFATSTIIVSGVQRRDTVAAGDIDRDGDLDLVIVDGFIDNVSWYENDDPSGDGSSWDPHPILSGGSNPTGVSLGDVDGDGYLDVVVCGALETRWFENREDQALPFADHSVDANLAGCANTELADIDADGDLDIHIVRIFIGSGGSGIVTYTNDDGVGSIWTRHDAYPSLAAAGAAVADIDRDGDLDLTIAHRGGDSLAIYANQGGQFGLPTADVAYSGMVDAQRREVLTIDLHHRGRSNDTDLEFATLELRFDDDTGTPLGTTQVEALISTLEVFTDTNQSGVFEDPGDSQAHTQSSFNLTGGVEIIAFSDGDIDAQVSQALESQRFFVVITLASDASGQVVTEFQIAHRTESSSTAEDRDNDIPLQMEYTPSRGTGLITALDAVGDADGDLLINGDEATIHFTDPLDADTDDDTLNDGAEVIANPYTSDPKDPDSDDDGLDDATESRFVFDPNDPDTDGDGFCDGPLNPGAICGSGVSDNCPAVGNNDQNNADSLAAGDACQCGDVDENNVVDAIDLQRIREHVVTRAHGGTFTLSRCDVHDTGDDGSEDCDVADAAVIEAYFRGHPATVNNYCGAYLGTGP